MKTVWGTDGADRKKVCQALTKPESQPGTRNDYNQQLKDFLSTAHEFIVNTLVATAFAFLLGIWCMSIYVHVWRVWDVCV